MSKKQENSFSGVSISSPSKSLFIKPKISKLDVVRYYDWIAGKMLPELKDRPLMLFRCPSGNIGPSGSNVSSCFYQKHHSNAVPFPTFPISEKEGRKPENYAYVRTAQDIIELVQLNTIEFHIWGSRIPQIEYADRIVFDLDPGNPQDHALVKEVALYLKDVLSELKLKSYLRISGGKGLHVVVPIIPDYTWSEVKNFSEALAIVIADNHPAVTANSRKVKRKNKVYLDYLRNGRGSTAVANYSVRARPGATIAAPIRWSDLEGISAFNFVNITNAKSALKDLGSNPWRGMRSRSKQKLPTHE